MASIARWIYDKPFRGGTASHLPTYKEFVLNMDEKLQDGEFLMDTEILPVLHFYLESLFSKNHFTYLRETGIPI